MREIHAILLAEGRGSEKQPGEFMSSKSEDWVFSIWEERTASLRT